MPVIVGSSDTSLYATSTAYVSVTTARAYFNGDGANDAQGKIATTTATAARLGLAIADWGTLNNAKFCLYEWSGSQFDLLETVIVNSSVGVGDVLINLSGSTAITQGNEYALAFYKETGDDLILFTRAGAGTRRRDDSATYANPVDPLPAGSWHAADSEFAWWIESAGPSLTVNSDNPVEDGATAVPITHNGFTNPPDTFQQISNDGTYELTTTISGTAIGDGTGTIDVQDIAAQIATGNNGNGFSAVTATGTTVLIRATDSVSGDTADYQITYNLPAGHAETISSGAVNTGFSAAQGVTPPPPDGTPAYYSTADGTVVLPDFRVQTNAASGSILRFGLLDRATGELVVNNVEVQEIPALASDAGTRLRTGYAVSLLSFASLVSEAGARLRTGYSSAIASLGSLVSGAGVRGRTGSASSIAQPGALVSESGGRSRTGSDSSLIDLKLTSSAGQRLHQGYASTLKPILNLSPILAFRVRL